MLKDYLNKGAEELKKKTLWLLDMDGTIYNENTLFDGTLDLLDRIEKNGGKYIFITNNSSKSVYAYLDKITKMGIKADLSNFFTSSQATSLFLNDKFKGIKVYCQGTKSLVEELEKSGINVTTKMEDDIGLVLLGFDTELTSEKLRTTCEILTTRKDIPFYATNPDLVCPVSFGYIPDCGSISIMVYNATKRKPIYIGKPETTMVEYVMKKFNKTKEDTIIVGDRLYTDIKTAMNADITSICVLSGEAKYNEIIEGDIKPTYIFNSVKDILI